MQKSVIGYGSIFHKQDVSHFPDIPSSSFLGEHTLFYAGRYAIKYIIHCITQERTIATIWLPRYYCPHVKNWLEQEAITVKYYDIDPFNPDAQVDWSPFSTLDLVLVNNYWGIKKNNIPEGNRPLLLEDHSHGWATKGCIESKADFCIASLRKTLPIPLAGIAWKPKNGSCNIPLLPLESINGTGSNPMTSAWNLIDAAMEKKSACLNPAAKVEFLIEYSQGELLLRNTQEIFSPQKAHEALIRKYLLKDFNAHKARNLFLIEKNIKPSNLFKVVTSNQGVPFGLLLAFKEAATLASFKKFMISKSIYPAELWPNNHIAQAYKFLLNIHIDYRYNENDMNYLANTINEWCAEKSGSNISRGALLKDELPK